MGRTFVRVLVAACLVGGAAAPLACKVETIEEVPEPEAGGPEEGPGPAEAPQPEPKHAWPTWRGPDGNAFSSEVPESLPPMKEVWSKPVRGECHAPLAVAGGRLIVPDFGAATDYWRCLDAATGRELWSHSYPNAREMDYGQAARTTPLIHGGKVYCLNAWGTLYCLDLEKGDVLWTVDFLTEFGAGEPPFWGYCCSPLMVDGKLIVNPGGSGGSVAALDPETGDLVWAGKGGGLNYATFMAGTFGGIRQVVGYDAGSLGGWDLASGERLWAMPVDTGDGYLVPTPVDVGGKVLLASPSESTRLHAFGEGGKIIPEPEAVNEDLYPEMSTPTVWGDVVLGGSEGLVLMDPADGLKTLWIEEEDPSLMGLCHFIVSEDRAMVFGDDGRVVLMAKDRTAPKILGRARLCGNTWVHPALANGRLFVRDAEQVICYDLTAAAEEGPAGEPAPGEQ